MFNVIHSASANFIFLDPLWTLSKVEGQKDQMVKEPVMPKVMFNAKMVEAIKPPITKKVEEYFDEKVKGLCLRVYASGTKTWTIRLKRGNDKKRISIGDAHILPLADAREKALEVLLAFLKGQDITTEKKPVMTFTELALEYVEKYSKPNKRTWAEDLRKINKDLSPHFGKKRIDEIRRKDVIDFLDEIVAEGFTIKVNRTHGLIREIFNFAVDREYLDESPASGIKKRIKEISRERVLSDDEVKKVWKAIDKIKSPTKEFFKLYFMTGQRGTEVKTILRANIDRSNMTIVIPQGTAKNGKLHLVPITSNMLQTIEHCLSSYRDSKWLFPSPQCYRRDKTSGDYSLKNIQKAIRRLRIASGVDFNGHDFRRTMATWLASKGVRRMTIQRLLNHSDRSVTAVYDRYSYETEKREALELWTKYLSEISN